MSKIEIPPLPVLPKQTKLSVLDVEILLHDRDRQIVELCASMCKAHADFHKGNRANPFAQGRQYAAEDLADAIRSLLNEPEGGC